MQNFSSTARSISPTLVGNPSDVAHDLNAMVENTALSEDHRIAFAANPIRKVDALATELLLGHPAGSAPLRLRGGMPPKKSKKRKGASDEPFGPFNEHSVFAWPRQVKRELKMLALERDGELIGFDDLTNTGCTRFRGFVMLPTFDGVSDRGMLLLREQHRLRAKERNEEDTQIRLPLIVVVQGVYARHQYLSEKYPDGLNIEGTPSPYATDYSGAWNNGYDVISITARTYDRSRTTFGRLAVHRFVRETCQANKLVPLPERTGEWFISKYLERFKTNDNYFESERRDPHGRIIHRRDVRNFFARHADAMASDLTRGQVKLVDPWIWWKFGEVLHNAKVEASRKGLPWGIVDRDDKPGKRATSKEPKRKEYPPPSATQPGPQRGKPKKRSRKHSLPSTLPPEDDAMPDAGPSASSLFTPPPSTRSERERSISLGGVEDSPPLLDEGEDVEEPEEERPTNPTLSDLLKLIPPELQQEPRLPASCEWRCPVKHCLFSLPFLRPTKDMTARLDARRVRYLINKDWNSDDPTILDILFILVDSHFRDHLAWLGLQVDDEGNIVRVRIL